MERGGVSRHGVLVAAVLQGAAGRWLSNQEIAAAAPGVALRTVRMHTRRLAHLGLVDRAEVFPGHRYRWSEQGARRNPASTRRLARAAAALGMDGPKS